MHGPNEMNQEPQPIAEQPAKRNHDGLAAVAIAVLTIALIVWLVSNLI